MSSGVAGRTTTARRATWWRLAIPLLLAVQVTLALTLPVAGPLSIDEVVYTEMTRSVANGSGFFIDNGYEKVASPELATRFVGPTQDGHLAAQYPYGLPLLAAVPYSVLGVRGILLLNAIAFAAVVVLTFEIARRLLRSRWIATASVAILIGATFAWEYSVAIWPHMSTLALGLGSIVAVLVAGDQTRRSGTYVALSGLLFGLAVLNRLDAVLLLPVLIVCLYRSSQRARSFLYFIAGLLPATVILSVSNWQRWGTPLPFSYGGSVTGWLLPIVAAGASVVALLVGVVYAARRYGSWSGRRVVVAGIAALVLALAVPVTRNLILDVVAGAWTLVVDLRAFQITNEGALVRLEDGTLVYFGTVKKALLQSAPYLVLIALPVVVTWRTAQRRTALLLMIPIVTYIGFFAPRAWHGGLSFNLRYFLPLLPFAAILTAWGLKIVFDRAGERSQSARLARIAALVTLGTFAVGRVAFSSIEGSAWLFSVPPLIIAAATVLALTLLISRPSEAAARLTVGVVLAGLTWASAVAYGYDVAATLNIRNSHSEASRAIADLIHDKSLLIADWPDNTFGVKEHLDEVVVALPENDQYETFGDLVAQFGATRAVYGAMTPESWERLPGRPSTSWTQIGVVGEYSIRTLEGTPATASAPGVQESR